MNLSANRTSEDHYGRSHVVYRSRNARRTGPVSLAHLAPKSDSAQRIAREIAMRQSGYTSTLD